MIKLYSEQELNIFKKQKQKYFYIAYSFAFLTIAICALFIVLATYQTRKIYIPICAVLATISTFFMIYFIAKTNFFKRTIFEYETLLTGKESVHSYKFENISLKPITLQDKSKVYEVLFKNDDQNVVLYLSNGFDNDIFIPNHNYLIVTVFDYVVGYEDED